MKRFVVLGLITMVGGTWLAPSAQALAPFKKAFQEKYVDKSTSEEFKTAFQGASCNVCHVKDKKKTERNDYGNALAELIEGDANKRIKEAGNKDGETKKILEELDKAFDEVAKKKSPGGETYGDLIGAGKLPVAS